MNVTTELASPEIGATVSAAGIATNYHDQGEGPPLLLIHGSGPGVTAWANWRLSLPVFARQFRTLAPDIAGFGYTERPADAAYGQAYWLNHLLGFLDALGIARCHVIGNSFGGALALALAAHHPERVDRLVLMGSVGVPFPITPGLEAVWGYEPSVPAMQELLRLFAYDQSLLGPDLAELRYRASIRPGYQESYRRLFPAPRQRGVDGLAVDEAKIAGLPHRTLLVHGREDRVIPPATSERLFALIPNAELHRFGKCGHWVQIEHAGRFTELVSAFLGAP